METRRVQLGGRQGQGNPPAFAPRDRRHMLANPWFWRFALVCAALWSLAAWALWRYL